jgi:ABC-type sugar transport system ATPase subunit
MPADRRQSLFFNLSVAANISSRLAGAQLSGRSRLLSRRTLARAAASYIERFNIKTEHAGASIGSLSGGNQQKVALASAMAVDPALLIIEEPTRGVDIRTKLQIYEILRAFTSSGGAVVMFVNELEDAIGCADHLYVVSDGTVRGGVQISRSDDLEKVGLVVNKLLSGDRYAA